MSELGISSKLFVVQKQLRVLFMSVDQSLKFMYTQWIDGWISCMYERKELTSIILSLIGGFVQEANASSNVFRSRFLQDSFSFQFSSATVPMH